MRIASTWKIIAMSGFGLALSACSSHNLSTSSHHAGYPYGTSSTHGALNGYTETRYGSQMQSSNCALAVPCGYYLRPQMVYAYPMPATVTNNYPTPETVYTQPEPVVITAPEPTPYEPVIEQPPVYIPPQTYPTPATPDPLPWLPPKK